jgi:hypothetical protein
MTFLARRLAGAAAVLFLSVLVASAADEGAAPAAPCAKETRITGREYWLYETSIGVDPGTESGDERVGRVLGTPPFDFCFRAPLAEIKDAAEHTKGAVEAVGRLTQHLPVSTQKEWATDPVTREVRAKIEAVTGQKFKTPADFGKWYADRDYVRWSEEKGILELDLQAKKTRQRVTELDVSELSPESYWTLEGSGHLSTSSREAGYVRGQYWDGFQERRFKILATALEDRGAREAGYRKAARSLAHHLERRPRADAAWVSVILKRYQELTGKRFPSPQACIDWCNANCGRLHLTAAGDRLTLAAAGTEQ